MNTEKKEISRKAGTASFRLRYLLYLLPVLLGVLFSLWYIRNAACDVVYSDYIRLIDSYLPEVTDPARFFVPDILTRIPAAFPARIPGSMSSNTRQCAGSVPSLSATAR